MKKMEVKDAIVNLLEEIVSRTNYINHHHPGKDMSLDIDLIKDDLRLLYRNFEALKKLAAEQPPAEDAGGKTNVTGNTPLQQEEPVQKNTQMPEETLAVPDESRDDMTIQEVKETRKGLMNPAPGVNPAKSTAAVRESALPSPETANQETTASVSESESDIPPKEPEQQAARLTPQEDNQTRVEPEKEKPKPDPAPVERTGTAFPTEQTSLTGNNSKNKTVIDLLSAYGKKTIGDQYAVQDNSVHQRIAGSKEDRSIGAQMQQKPVSNIKDVIGVNEKFLFINELFDGNIQAYYDAIARLNDFENMQTAFDYLNELSAQFAWDAGRSTVTIEKLANYVQRRYA